MRLTLLEWSNKESRFKAVTLNVTAEQLRMTGKERSYRENIKSKKMRQDKHRFYIDRPGSKAMRVRWWTYRAVAALLSHGTDVECLKHLIVLRNTVRQAEAAVKAAEANADAVTSDIPALRAKLKAVKQAFAKEQTADNRNAVTQADIELADAKAFAEPFKLVLGDAKLVLKNARDKASSLRHADGSYAGTNDSRGTIQTPSGYVVVGRPAWIDTMLTGWEDRPDGGSGPQASTYDCIRATGTKAMRWSDVVVSTRYYRDRWCFNVTVNGDNVLVDASQAEARRWAAEHTMTVDRTTDYWRRLEAADAARSFRSDD